MKCIEAKFQKLWVRESPKYFQEYLIGGNILKCFKTLFLDKSLQNFDTYCQRSALLRKNSENVQNSLFLKLQFYDVQSSKFWVLLTGRLAIPENV